MRARLDPLLVGLIAALRLVPLIAVVVYLRGATAKTFWVFALVGWALTALSAARSGVVGLRVRRRAASDTAHAIAKRAPGALRGTAYDAYQIRLWRGFSAQGLLATDVEPTVVAMLMALPCAVAIAWIVDGPLVPLLSAAAAVVALLVRAPLARMQLATQPPVQAAATRMAKDLAIGMRALDDLHAHGLAPRFADRVAEDAMALQEADRRQSFAMQLTSWTPMIAAALVVIAGMAPTLTARAPSLLMRSALLLAMSPIGVALARSLASRSRLLADAEGLAHLIAAPADLQLPSNGRSVASLLPIELDAITFVHPPAFETKREVEPPAVFERITTLWDGARPLGLLGANGSGKTTYLGLLLRIAVPTQGRVILGGVDAAELDSAAFRSRVAFIPQRPLVLEGMSVREAMQLIAPDAPDASLREALTRLGVAFSLDATCNTLSVGETQRVAIARALVRKPELLVADEPEATLDPAARMRLRDLFEELADAGTKLVIATQHPDVLPRNAVTLQLPLPAGAKLILDGQETAR